MKIIEPKVELWKQGNDTKAHVARCARVCYGRETGNDEATIKRLIDSRHWSMFRHETYYAAVPIKKKIVLFIKYSLIIRIVLILNILLMIIYVILLLMVIL